MSHTIRIHRHALSGHSHRVELFASLTSIPYQLIDVDLAGGEHKKPAFLAINSAGQLPVIEDEGTVLADSNAILVYLARKYAPQWLPSDVIDAARIQQYLSIAAGEISFGPATARLTTVFGAALDFERAKQISERVFTRLESELISRDWLVCGRPTIADIALYSYTAHAPEGNISLEAYPGIRAWLARIEALPGFVPMQATPVGLAA